MKLKKKKIKREREKGKVSLSCKNNEVTCRYYGKIGGCVSGNRLNKCLAFYLV